MVTNINLSAPETTEKRSLSGKSALIFSGLILAIVFVAYFVLSFMKSKYTAQEKEISTQISQEQGKISGVEFVDIFDFQGRLNLSEKIVDDHAYWNNLLVNMAGYVIPEARLESFSGKIDSSGTASVDISGVATNLDALSRELILLKSFPNLDSMEFKSAGEKKTQDGQQELGGVAFEASLKISKPAFQK